MTPVLCVLSFFERSYMIYYKWTLKVLPGQEYLLISDFLPIRFSLSMVFCGDGRDRDGYNTRNLLKKKKKSIVVSYPLSTPRLINRPFTMPARRRASIMGCGNVLSGYESVRQERLAECREMVQEKFALSQLPDLRSTAPAFQTQEVDFGEVLGRGKFGTVSEVRAFLVPGVSPENLYNSSRQLQVTIDDDHAHEERMNPREFLAKHCVRADGHGRYAIKTMSSSVISDTDAFIQGVQNMAIESRILAGLDHPNIIKLRGVASVDPFNEYFFFVMDRLYTSFEQQIEEWEQRTKVKGGLKLSLFGSKSKAESITKEIYKEKIVSMFHLADALAYMHTQNVIYRNLKVQNVGLDIVSLPFTVDLWLPLFYLSCLTLVRL